MTYNPSRRQGTALASAGAGILLTILLLIPPHLEAQTKMTIGPSPDKSVTVTALGKNTPFEKAFNAETDSSRDMHAIVTNNSDRAIVAAIVQWHYTDAKGITRGVLVASDSWQRPHSGPNDKAEVVPAHSRALFGPTATILEAHIGASGLTGAAIMPIRFTPFEGFTNPDFAIDLLVFSDGEMVGPDTKHYSTDIPARYSAGQRVVAAWKLGGGDAVRALLDNRPTTREEAQEWNWLRRYADDLTRSKNLVDASAAVDYIANSPKPIALFRRAD